MHLCRSITRSVKRPSPSSSMSALCVFMTSIIMAFAFSSSAMAVNISAYRIYLDEDKRDVSFVIFNRQGSYQDCTLNLAHNNFDAQSQLIHLPNDVIPENSAQDWIRYSPREFILTPSQSQTVRFTMRRKANAPDGEYRSYLVVDCGVTAAPDGSESVEAQVMLQPRLVHSVPIIVRSGKLDATVRFDDFRLNGDVLTFSLLREGTRSVYGNLEIIDKKTGDVVYVQRNFSIYPESQKFNFKVNERNLDLNNLKFIFTENKEYGGDIVLEHELSKN